MGKDQAGLSESFAPPIFINFDGWFLCLISGTVMVIKLVYTYDIHAMGVIEVAVITLVALSFHVIEADMAFVASEVLAIA
jgi:hypothetical protein